MRSGGLMVAFLMMAAFSGCIGADGAAPPAADPPSTGVSAWPAAPAAPPEPQKPCTAWPIDTLVGVDQTVADGHYCLDAPVTVLPAATLTIRNATLRFNQVDAQCLPQFCKGDLTVQRTGQLIVQDSVLTTDRWTGGHPGYWNIRLDEGTFTASNSTFVHVLRVGSYAGSGNVQGSTFRDGYEGLRSNKGSLVARENIFYNMSVGVYSVDDSLVMEDNLFLDGYAGAWMLTSTLGGETVMPTADVAANRFYGGHTALLVQHDGRAAIHHNHMEGMREGMWLQARFVLDDLDPQPLLVEYNTLRGNAWDINVTPLTDGLPGRTGTVMLDHNRFEDTDCTSIHGKALGEMDLTIDARHNWWGSPEGPVDRSAECPAVSGDATILVDPWLRESPDTRP